MPNKSLNQAQSTTPASIASDNGGARATDHKTFTPELFARFCELLGDHLAFFDEECRYISINEKGLQVLGKTSEEVIGKRIWEVFPAAKGNEFCLAIQCAFHERKNVSHEHYFEYFGRWSVSAAR